MQNIFDTIEKCDKHFGETTFANVSSETHETKNNDIDVVVDVNVDDVNNDETIDNIETTNNLQNGGNEDEC